MDYSKYLRPATRSELDTIVSECEAFGRNLLWRIPATMPLLQHYLGRWLSGERSIARDLTLRAAARREAHSGGYSPVTWAACGLVEATGCLWKEAPDLLSVQGARFNLEHARRALAV